ncbi:MAG: hypothetical protein NVSMB47_05260 [Polyangiales bacterium]
MTDAQIVVSGGTDFDAAALAAAKRLVFAPATADGQPIPAKIARYRFRFDFKDAPKPSDAATAPAKGPVVDLTGVVRGPDEAALAGATVVVVAADGSTAQTTTDAKGRFTFADLPDGAYVVRVAADGFDSFEARETVKRSVVTDVVYRPPLSGGGVDIVVRGDKPPREVVKREITQAEIARIPGTNGDALRAIQNLPGVGRPPGFAGLLIIRGSAPTDTNVFVDGTLVPLVYHFGGLSSVVPTEVIEKIDFYPGNFGPEYGRVMGGIIDVGLRSPNRDEYHGLLQLDLIDGRMLVEGPIDKKTRFLVAGRRSWVDVWLKPVLEKAGTGVSTAPVYYDYQLMAERDLDERNTARVTLFGSDDKLAITLNSPSAADPALGGDLSLHTAFWRLQGRVESRIAKDVKWINSIAYGGDTIEFGVGDYFFQLHGKPVLLRSDLRAKLSSETALIVGLDGLWEQYDVGLKFPPPPRPGEAPGPFFARPAPELHGTGAVVRPAAYALFEISPLKVLKLLPAIRVDYSRDTARWDVSPRFATRLDVAPAFPKTTLKGGVGIFYQPPQPNESIEPFGTKGLRDNRATHYDVGVEQDVTRHVNVSFDGFFKDLQDLVVRQSSNATASGLSYSNSGSGRVYGAEMLLRWLPDDHFFGWVSYTLSHSQRRDTPSSPIRNASFDQTHILTVLGSYKLGRGWQVGARFRYVSGAMYTPNQGGVADFDAGAYAPIPTYPAFGARLPSFNQLDVRLDKEWKFASWRLSGYLDVQNVYNRQNPEGVSYNYNYSQQSTISGLPILPVIGLRGEL